MSDPKASIMSRIRLASEIPTTPKFLLVGEHGSGKTHTMATFCTPKRRMLAAVFEGSQSISTIQQAAPDCDIIEIGTIGDWRELYKVIVSGEIEAAGYKILGVDSLTEMQAYYARSMEEEKKQAAKSKDGKSSGSAKDNKWEQFRKMKSNMSNVLVFLRDLPFPVVATVRAKPETDEDTGITSVRISLDGAIRYDVGAFFSATAFIYKADTDADGRNTRAAMFSGSPTYPCRELGPLRGICVPDGDVWMQAMYAKETPSGLYMPGTRLPDSRRSSSSTQQEVAEV